MLRSGLGLLTLLLWGHLVGQSITQALLLPIGIGPRLRPSFRLDG
jgi:hypothetical protein